MFLNLYTDKAKGILSEQRFVKLTAAMEREQEENQKQLKELALSLRRSNEQESDVRTFIREIRQYATVRELDEGILNRLISRILVGEVKKVGGEKFQEIKIIYNFVGEITENCHSDKLVSPFNYIINLLAGSFFRKFIWITKCNSCNKLSVIPQPFAQF